MSNCIDYKTHILICVRASGTMTVICHWSYLPRQAEVQQQIAGAFGGGAFLVRVVAIAAGKSSEDLRVQLPLVDFDDPAYRWRNRRASSTGRMKRSSVAAGWSARRRGVLRKCHHSRVS